ncbi:dihydroneopterin aldolase [Halarcobacter ebronensis]|uniref:dihydroneopterin aldolase n=1 Tax=Halarcobacter ebronensis TaxID=1462615 RepID=A0A4Q1AXV2_9BACT|nr:dihydroneopterin aldolase [Halarcobacter ebronensis]QKF80928.1 dihydroneopterin aldolase [Halarcobacter ebronensis]RXK06246.1 dihydroneopterin aldolase [Halarcobacter ebronensis]
MKISIENLTFYCIIGILDFEREKEQKVILDISFKYNYNNSSNFIDYSSVTADIEAIMKEKRFKLIEEAIIYLDKFLKEKYSIKKVKIKISKPNILPNCRVSINNS